MTDAGPILALSFGLLVAETTIPCAVLAAVQAALLALLAVRLGLYPEASLLLLLNAAAVPWLLTTQAPATPPRPRIPLVPRLACATILALLVTPVSAPLAIVLLGILTAAAARDRAIQGLGLLAMQNGIALSAFTLGDVERIAAIMPVIPVLACAALRIRPGRAA
jgi:hydrogenase-4 membrane subunit HyfE